MAPSPYWGDEPIWDSADQHPQPDDRREGPRVVHRARAPAGQPGLLQGKGSDHPSAKVFPIEQLEPAPVDVRSEDAEVHADQHLLPDASPRSSPRTRTTRCGPRAAAPAPGVVGWLNRKMFEETGDEQKSQGWTPFVLDTNGNGKRDEWVEPEPAGRSGEGQARRTSASTASPYNPADGSIWGTSLGFPGYVVRVDPGHESDRNRAHGNLRAAVRRATARAAATSTATASSGRRSRAAISASSTAASARAAQRPDRDRQALPGRLDAVPHARARSSAT